MRNTDQLMFADVAAVQALADALAALQRASCEALVTGREGSPVDHVESALFEALSVLGLSDRRVAAVLEVVRSGESVDVALIR